MHNYQLLLALDIARQRTAEANAQRLASLAHPVPPVGTRVRRSFARLAMNVARTLDHDVESSLLGAGSEHAHPA